MKIFVIPAIFPRDENHQLGNYIYEQCEVLKKNGHELVILDCSSYNYKNFKKCNKLHTYPTPVGKVYANHTVGIAQSRLPRLAVTLYLKNVRQAFKRATKDFGMPDFLYAHFTFPCGYAAKLLSDEYNVPYVVQEHYSLFLRKNLPEYLKTITCETIKSASAFFCVSQSLKSSIEKFTGITGKIGVVNNLINEKYRYYPVPDNGIFTFFAAGNLVKSKKFDLLIEAFSFAFKNTDNVELRIAGDGIEAEYLKRLATEKKTNIVFLGRLTTDKMLEEYKNCNCFVLLSEFETFGIVYREALATGRPIIATKNGGIEENWSNSFGFLIDKNNFEKSVDALQKMLTQYSEFNPETISDKTLSLYSEKSIYKLLNEQFDNIKF